MDWTGVTNLLKDTVWGIIILSAIGSGLLLLVLNLVGRANRKIRLLWLFYKIGRRKFIIMVANSDEEYSFAKWFVLCLLVISFGGVNLVFSTGLEKGWDDVFAAITQLLLMGIAFILFFTVSRAGRRRVKIEERKNKK